MWCEVIEMYCCIYADTYLNVGARYVHASIPIEQGYGNRVLTFTVGTSWDATYSCSLSSVGTILILSCCYTL